MPGEPLPARLSAPSIPLLAAKGLVKSFGGRRILDCLDLDIADPALAADLDAMSRVLAHQERLLAAWTEQGGDRLDGDPHGRRPRRHPPRAGRRGGPQRRRQVDAPQAPRRAPRAAAGTRWIGPGIEPGCLDQAAAGLPMDADVIDALRAGRSMSEEDAVRALMGFLFDYEQTRAHAYEG